MTCSSLKENLAPRYGIAHAQFEHVSSRIEGMESLFDKDRPHFGSWIRLYDADSKPDVNSIFPMFTSSRKPRATPLYYAALCGFRDVSKHIIDRYPQDLNARGGYYDTRLDVALPE